MSNKVTSEQKALLRSHGLDMNTPWGNAYNANTTKSNNVVARPAAVARPAVALAPKVRSYSTRANVWKPRPGKIMRECTTSNVAHSFGNKGPCKFVHRNNVEHSHLRNDQKKPAGGTRKRRGGAIVVVPSPAPLSKVNTYTSWPGGIDPTVPLYNQKTMLGGKNNRSRKSRTLKASRR